MCDRKADVIILGAGASGLFCALSAAKRGRHVLVLDHQSQAASKVLVSGGGKCNFTNLSVTPENYLSQNPNFCISALKRFSPFDCISFFQQLGVSYVEREQGQLFCASSAKHLVKVLLQACEQEGVTFIFNCNILQVDQNDHFSIKTNQGTFCSESFVIATGGLSYPQLGASRVGYDIAQQFGLNLIASFPALVPLKFNPQDTAFFRSLAGISFEVAISLKHTSFCDDLLFTHQGLSGPAILQISSYWKRGDMIEINVLPKMDLLDYLKNSQLQRPNTTLRKLLSELLPRRFVECACERWIDSNYPVSQYAQSRLKLISDHFQHWVIQPTSTLGYSVAEVTAGGVDTRELSSKTFESKKMKGLYFIGEVVDVTGQLGGYNLQWAWSSGYCCGQFV